MSRIMKRFYKKKEETPQPVVQNLRSSNCSLVSSSFGQTASLSSDDFSSEDGIMPQDLSTFQVSSSVDGRLSNRRCDSQFQPAQSHEAKSSKAFSSIANIAARFRQSIGSGKRPSEESTIPDDKPLKGELDSTVPDHQVGPPSVADNLPGRVPQSQAFTDPRGASNFQSSDSQRQGGDDLEEFKQRVLQQTDVADVKKECLQRLVESSSGEETKKQKAKREEGHRFIWKFMDILLRQAWLIFNGRLQLLQNEVSDLKQTVADTEQRTRAMQASSLREVAALREKVRKVPDGTVEAFDLTWGSLSSQYMDDGTRDLVQIAVSETFKQVCSDAANGFKSELYTMIAEGMSAQRKAMEEKREELKRSYEKKMKETKMNLMGEILTLAEEKTTLQIRAESADKQMSELMEEMRKAKEELHNATENPRQVVDEVDLQRRLTCAEESIGEVLGKFHDVRGSLTCENCAVVAEDDEESFDGNSETSSRRKAQQEYAIGELNESADDELTQFLSQSVQEVSMEPLFSLGGESAMDDLRMEQVFSVSSGCDSMTQEVLAGTGCDIMTQVLSTSTGDDTIEPLFSMPSSCGTVVSTHSMPLNDNHSDDGVPHLQLLEGSIEVAKAHRFSLKRTRVSTDSQCSPSRRLSSCGDSSTFIESRPALPGASATTLLERSNRLHNDFVSKPTEALDILVELLLSLGKVGHQLDVDVLQDVYHLCPNTQDPRFSLSLHLLSKWMHRSRIENEALRNLSIVIVETCKELFRLKAKKISLESALLGRIQGPCVAGVVSAPRVAFEQLEAMRAEAKQLLSPQGRSYRRASTVESLQSLLSAVGSTHPMSAMSSRRTSLLVSCSALPSRRQSIFNPEVSLPVCSEDMSEHDLGEVAPEVKSPSPTPSGKNISRSRFQKYSRGKINRDSITSITSSNLGGDESLRLPPVQMTFNLPSPRDSSILVGKPKAPPGSNRFANKAIKRNGSRHNTKDMKEKDAKDIGSLTTSLGPLSPVSVDVRNASNTKRNTSSGCNVNQLVWTGPDVLRRP